MTDSPSLLMAVRAIKAQALRDAADELEATVRASAAAKTRREATSKSQRSRDKATGHRLGASLTAARWLRERADHIEKGDQP